MEEEKQVNNQDQSTEENKTKSDPNGDTSKNSQGEMGTTGVVIISLFAVVLLVLGYMYFFANNSNDDDGPRPTKRPTMETTQKQPANTPTPTPEPLKDWKTYEDETGLYSFKYPPEMEDRPDPGFDVKLLKTGPDQTGGSISDGLSVTMYKTTKNADVDLSVWLENKGIVKYEDISVDGFSGLQVSGFSSGAYHDDIYIELSSHNILVLSAYYAGEARSEDYKSIFKSILGSVNLHR